MLPCLSGVSGLINTISPVRTSRVVGLTCADPDNIRVWWGNCYISDGKDLFAARDLLGIKTLFYGQKADTLYLASELKAILPVTREVYEFPNGHYLDQGGQFARFAELPQSSPRLWDYDVEKMTADIREIIERSFRNRIDFDHFFLSFHE